MLNLRQAYRQSDEHLPLILFCTVAILTLSILGIVFFSPLSVLGILIAIFFFVLTIVSPLSALTFLAVYLPLEPFLLKWIPDDIYLYARFFSEALIYLIFAVALIRLVLSGERLRTTPLTFPFVLFLVVLGASAIINLVDPTIALFGIRSIVRFILVFFAVIMLRPSKEYIRRLTIILFAVVAMEAGIGLMQAVSGSSLDSFLLPSDTRVFGEFQLTEGTVQFWDPGSRIFATLGRYDRLGTFLGFFLIIGVGFLYEKYIRRERKELWALFLLGIPALALTYSRSAWFGFVLGALFIAIWLKRDRKVMIGLGIVGAIIAGYLVYSGLVVSRLIDVPQQTIVERFFEAFSYERWQGVLRRRTAVLDRANSDYGCSGFAVVWLGPGTYGGGAAILFHNTKVYDQLGLPFGVYATEGYIDNNWFSLWGETGTLGIFFFLWMYAAIFWYAIRFGRTTSDGFTRALAFGFAGAMIAVALNAFLATYFEVRTLAVYLWMYAGFIAVLGEQEKLV